EVDATVSAMPSVLFDAVVLPDGASAVVRLAADGRVIEFVKDQYRHCKPLLVLGAGRELLQRAQIPESLISGAPDPGIVVGMEHGDGMEAAFNAFIEALGKHRHFERETDPPHV